MRANFEERWFPIFEWRGFKQWVLRLRWGTLPLLSQLLFGWRSSGRSEKQSCLFLTSKRKHLSQSLFVYSFSTFLNQVQFVIASVGCKTKALLKSGSSSGGFMLSSRLEQSSPSRGSDGCGAMCRLRQRLTGDRYSSVTLEFPDLTARISVLTLC